MTAQFVESRALDLAGMPLASALVFASALEIWTMKPV